jgi:hypothetical protein
MHKYRCSKCGGEVTIQVDGVREWPCGHEGHPLIADMKATCSGESALDNGRFARVAAMVRHIVNLAKVWR